MLVKRKMIKTMVTVLFLQGAVVTTHAQTLSNEELGRRVDILGQEIQKLKVGAAAEPLADQSQYGLGPAASKVYRASNGFSIGGYGEILFESFRSGSFAPYGRGTAENRIDLKRFVLYAGYRFSDDWVMNSELEWEHGGDETPVEFMYFDHFLKPSFNLRFGKVLLPMGFINEVHEPVTYYGSHRTLTETYLIPSTWSEYGAGVFGDLGSDWTYRSYVVTGLNSTEFSEAKGIREGRNETGIANATRFAWTGRLDYTGVSGLLAGSSAYVGEAVARDPTAGTNSGLVQIFESHVHWTRGAFDLRAIGAYSRVLSQPISPERFGGFVQAAYEFGVGSGAKSLFAPFARYEVLRAPEVVATVAGVQYKPISSVVLKADHEWFHQGESTFGNQFNLSLGYVF